jgi:membrane-bound lytic murein transglycosylase D
LLFLFDRLRTRHTLLYWSLAAMVSFLMTTGCGSTRKNVPISTLSPTPTGSDTVPVGAPPSISRQATTDSVADNDTAYSEEDTTAEDPAGLIENARAFCVEGNFAAADSSLKRAVRTIEAIDAESDSAGLASSRYVAEIVSLYNNKMPPQYSVPDEIAQTVFQGQMVRSLDSMNIMPAESLAIAAMGCQKNITYDVPMIWNDRVQRAMFFYVKNRSNTIDRWFYRASCYLPFMRRMFADSGLPQDLAYLPLIESGFNPLAYSYAAASGIWQFISSTGRIYGLRHNYWLDERRDPIRSTQGAIAYLKKLYGDFGHWYLALAAYNCGENGVSHVISRCKSNDFWKLKHLPAQTRNYVPCYLAAVTIAKNPKCFGVFMPPVDTFSLDTVLVSDCIRLDDIAEGVGVSADSLKKMNAHILRWCTPPDISNTVLYLPRGRKKAFADFYAQLPGEKKIKWCRYQIKPGDNIQKIAARFTVSIDDIKTINRLKNNAIAAGHFLFLPVRDPAFAGTPLAYIPPTSPYDEDDYTDICYYYIRKGDAISKIARRFHVTWSQLYRWNHLSSSSKLRPGRRLIVRPLPPPEPIVAVAPPQHDTLKQGQSYVVHLGDTPFSIARRAGVTINELFSWNNIDATQPIIHVGDTLKLSAPEKTFEKPAEQPATVRSAASASTPEPTAKGGWHDTSWTTDWSSAIPDQQQLASQAPATTGPDSINATAAKTVPSNVVYYKVKGGDTLFRIASTFGVTIEQLYKDNDLKPDSVIVPGKVIKVIKAGVQ